jgi:predicted nucleic acid-binding protein
LTLEAVPSGTRVFVDAPVFIYHFTGVSAECRAFLERCEQREVAGLTSSVVVAEVAHQLMMIEAVARGLLPAGNVARRLREKPEVVRQLHTYQEQVERIPLMGIGVVPLDLQVLLRSADARRRHGLPTHHSLVVTTALQKGIAAMASANADLERVPELQLYQPGDLA